MSDQITNQKNAQTKTEIQFEFSSPSTEEASSESHNSTTVDSSSLSIEIPSNSTSMDVNFSPSEKTRDDLSSVSSETMSPEESRRTIGLSLETAAFGNLERIQVNKNKIQVEKNLVSPIPSACLLNSANLLGTPKPETTPMGLTPCRNHFVERAQRIRNREKTPFPTRKSREIKRSSTLKRRFPRASTPSPERDLENENYKEKASQNTLIEDLNCLEVSPSAQSDAKAFKIARMEPTNLEIDAFKPVNEFGQLISPITSTAENSFASEDQENQEEDVVDNNAILALDSFELSDSSSPQLKKSGILCGNSNFLNQAVLEINPLDLISDDDEQVEV